MPYLKTFVLSACFAGVILVNLPVRGTAQETLPAGEGKDVVQRICTGCHGIETALDQARTEAQWKAVVDTMIGRGAEGTDAEFALVVKYLVKNFGIKE
ncbi:MAG TPA: cytochrome c [Bryobacteraceae bacterium]|jgi:competence protein ComEA|nr:cytochrome c [Bryobacteraceae bacterium]